MGTKSEVDVRGLNSDADGDICCPNLEEEEEVCQEWCAGGIDVAHKLKKGCSLCVQVEQERERKFRVADLRAEEKEEIW